MLRSRLSVSMPSKYSSGHSRSDAEQLADNLGICFVRAGIQGVVDSYHETLREPLKQIRECFGVKEADDDGVAQKGLIVRHLILPNGLAGSGDSLSWLVNEVSPSVTVSIMSQYFPSHRASKYPLLARKISLEEYEEVSELIDRLGIENGWVQEIESAGNYLPDFSHEEPFSAGVGKLK